MRTTTKHSVPLSWRTRAWLCAVFLLLTCPLATGTMYEAGTPITDVSITNPVANEVWLAGSDHTLTCTTSTDTDRQCDTTYWYDVDDSVTHHWTGTGTFKDNDNIGTSVTYICTNSAGNNTVTVDANDDYAPDNNTAIVNETAKSDTETVVVSVPEIVEVNFQLGGTAYNLKTHAGDSVVSSSTVAEYERTVGAQNPTTNHSAVFLKGAPISLKVKISGTSALTEASDALTVRFVHSDVSNRTGTAANQTFGTSWPYSSGTISSADSIGYIHCGKYNNTNYSYKSTSGSDTWIALAPQDIVHTICSVAAEPSYGPHYEWVARSSCLMGGGISSDSAETIMDEIFVWIDADNFACVDSWTTELNYAFPDPGSNFSVDSLLDDTEGSCGDWRRYFLALGNVQGIDATDGLKSGNFKFNGNTQATHPWKKFRVEHKGINNDGDPSQAANHDIVDDGKYPNPAQNDVSSVQKKWWWATGAAFADHSVAFLDVTGDGDSLYDASFPPGNSPAAVTYPGTSGVKTYDGDDNFMTGYFESSCPYLYGPIDVQYDEDPVELHIHTDDFDNNGANPADIKFEWAELGGQWNN